MHLFLEAILKWAEQIKNSLTPPKKMSAPHLYEMDRLGQTARHCAPSTACQQAGPRETVAPSGCSGKETAASLSAAGSRVLRFRECKSIFQTSEEYMNLKECQQ